MKTVNRKTKQSLLFALSAVAALSIGAGVGSVRVAADESAANDSAKLETMATGGAAIRLKGDWGIRFQTTMKATDYADLTAENADFVTGVLVIPTDLLDSADDLTLENAKVGNAVTYNGEVNNWEEMSDESGNYEAYAFIGGEDIPDLSYSRNLSFRGYYTVNDETTYTAVNTRSMTYVAQVALADEQSGLEEDQKTKAQGFVKDYTVAYVDGVTNELLKNATVSAQGKVEENKLTNDQQNPELFGGVFDKWTCLNQAWGGKDELLTGDTVVKPTTPRRKCWIFLPCSKCLPI